MRATFVSAAVLMTSFVSSVAPAATPADVDATLKRGLAFLAKDAVAWRDEHQCVSCHHAALVVWSLHEAKRQGQTVDEPLLAELTKWIAESGDGTTGVPRPESVPQAFNEKAVSFALALVAVPDPDAVVQQGTKKLLGTIKNDQQENGVWQSWPETRPPLFGHSDERATISALLALLPAAMAGDVEAITARDRGVQWLSANKTDGDPQSIALRIALWQKLGRPADEMAPLLSLVRQRQNADGGWSQSPEMASDAWATGQALYALASAGIKRDDPAIERGQSFLVATQRDDGSWPMTSRPTKPGGDGSTSLIPIVGAGSAWGVIGLARSTGGS